MQLHQLAQGPRSRGAQLALALCRLHAVGKVLVQVQRDVGLRYRKGMWYRHDVQAAGVRAGRLVSFVWWHHTQPPGILNSAPAQPAPLTLAALMRSTVELFQASPSNATLPPPARASTCVACAASCAATRVSAASWCAELLQSPGDATPHLAPACKGSKWRQQGEAVSQQAGGEPGMCLLSCQIWHRFDAGGCPSSHLLRRICQVCRAAGQRLARLHRQHILDKVTSSLQVHHCRQGAREGKKQGS